MKKILSSVLYTSRLSSAYTFDSDGKVNGVTKDVQTLHNELKSRLKLTLLDFPEGEEFDWMIENIFKPTDIPMLTHCRVSLTPVAELIERVGVTENEGREIIEDMIERGVIRFLTIEGAEFVGVPDFLIGFYEFLMVHFSEGKENIEAFEERTGITFDELNETLGRYVVMYTSAGYDPEKYTPVMRATPYQLNHGEPNHTITYESAKGLVKNAENVAVINCSCKYHEVVAVGDELPEDIPLRSCMILDYAAETFVELGKGTMLSTEEALDLLEQLNKTGHMHHADHPFDAKIMCNCHKDTCGLMRVFRETGVYVADKSNFVPVFDPESCKRCGVCVERCILDILKMNKETKVVEMIEGGEKICSGCLNCFSGCEYGAIDYVAVEEEDRIEYPKDKIEQTVYSALKRGKLNTLLFDDPLSSKDKIGRKIMGMVENNPIGKKMFRDDERAKRLSKKLGDKAREKFRKKIEEVKNQGN